MAVGGMRQAVEAYVNGKNFEEIDKVKRTILKLYEEDFYKIDHSGRLSKMYNSIPNQLAANKKRYVISSATGKRMTNKDKEIFSELLDSKTSHIRFICRIRDCLLLCFLIPSIRYILRYTVSFFPINWRPISDIFTRMLRLR